MTDDAKNSKPFLRLPEIIAPNGPIPVGKSTWWEGVRNGRFPKPVKFGPRITVWKRDDIDALVKSILNGEVAG